MARPSLELVQALRATAQRMRDTQHYSWGHMGSCNCGHLAQTVTRLDRAEIHRRAMERAGDWGQQALEACPASGFALDHVLESMFEIGLARRDIEELEELSGREVLARLPGGHRHLRRNSKDDAILYLETWASQLEESLEPQPRSVEPVESKPESELAESEPASIQRSDLAAVGV